MDDPSTQGPLLIIADNYRMAIDYARGHGLGREGRRWRYIRGWRDALDYGRGYSRGGGRYVLLSIPGGYLGHRDRMERIDVLDYLRASGFRSVEDA